MALVVEDGTGLATANSYVTIVETDAYFLARNEALWIGSQAVKEAALIKATLYVDRKFIGRWKGLKTTANQALQWPRMWGVDLDGYSIYGIRNELKEAVHEAALASLSETLLPSYEAPVKSKTIGPISTTWAVTDSIPKKYEIVHQLLRPLLKSGADAMRG